MNRVTLTALVAGLAVAVSGSAAAANRSYVLPNGDRIDVFDEAGDWTWTPSQDVSGARVLIVGGGGSGGPNAGGGGAGGQIVYQEGLSFQAGQAYPITIGAGGASKTQWTAGEAGGATTFSGITANGGGAGSSSGATAQGTAGANSGGSNGGGVQMSVTGKNDPANGWYGAHTGGAGCNFGCGGGGGGAMGDGGNGSYVGSDSKDGDGGVGGEGFPCEITGQTVYYACGGGGGSKGLTPGAGGSGSDTTAGAGGYKNNTPAGSGLAGTGSGGGGGGCTTSGQGISGAGGTGAVVIRYPSATPWAEVSDYEGLIDGEPHNVTVTPTFAPDGTTMAFSADDGATWQPDFGRTARGVSTVKVRLSAPGYQDFVATATVTLKDAEDDNDGTRFFVVPPDTPDHVAVPPYASWNTAATSIQDAVDAVGTAKDAQIFVRSGVYPLAATLMLTNADATVRSWKKDVGSLDPENTVVDAGAPLQSIRAVRMRTTNLRGLTVRNGSCGDGAGGGVYFESGRGAAVPADFERCVFTNNFATGNGGAVYAAAAVRFKDCLFAGNSARNANVTGGAVTCGQAGVFDDCEFRGNEAFGSWACGGAIRGNSALTVVGCTFDDNALNSDSSEYGSGAAVNATSVAALMVSNCVFRNHTRMSARTRGLLSGPAQSSPTSLIVGCTFANSSWGESIRDGAKLAFDRCSFSASPSTMVWDGDVSARNCLFVDSLPPGRACSYLCRYENCTFVRTPAARTCAGMVGVALVNCAFSGNASDYTVESGAGAVLFVTNCLTTVSGIETFGPDNAVVSGMSFTDPQNGDYSIRRASPCRDAGRILGWMSAAATDLAGNPRVMKDGHGLADDPTALPDVGCYENTASPVGLILLLR